MRRRCGGEGDDRGVNDGGKSGSKVRAAVIAAANEIVTAVAMEVATAMEMATARWWFGSGSRGGNDDDLGRWTTTTQQPT